MSPFKALTVTISLLFACSKGDDEIEKRVYLYCSDFTDDLNKMSENYQARLKLVQTTTLSEQQAMYADIKYGVVGREGRGERGSSMERAFSLCSGVKHDDQNQISPLRKRFSHASQTYVEAGDLTTAAKAAGDMAVCVNELQKLELRHD